MTIIVIIDTGIMFLCIATIFFCQVVLYFETCRHEREIATQQVSVKVREKFVKEKKAFKLIDHNYTIFLDA